MLSHLLVASERMRRGARWPPRIALFPDLHARDGYSAAGHASKALTNPGGAKNARREVGSEEEGFSRLTLSPTPIEAIIPGASVSSRPPSRVSDPRQARPEIPSTRCIGAGPSAHRRIVSLSTTALGYISTISVTFYVFGEGAV